MRRMKMLVMGLLLGALSWSNASAEDVFFWDDPTDQEQVDIAQRIIVRLFGGNNKKFDTATKPLDGLLGDDNLKQASYTSVIGKTAPPPNTQGGYFVRFKQDSTDFLMPLKGKSGQMYAWHIPMDKFAPAWALARMEVGRFPSYLGNMESSLWDVSRLGSGDVVKSKLTWKREVDWIWEDGDKKAIFSGPNGEFSLTRSGVLFVYKSPIDTLPKLGRVEKNKVAVCLAGLVTKERPLTTVEVTAALDWMKVVKEDKLQSTMLPAVVNYCLAKKK